MRLPPLPLPKTHETRLWIKLASYSVVAVAGAVPNRKRPRLSQDLVINAKLFLTTQSRRRIWSHRRSWEGKRNETNWKTWGGGGGGEKRSWNVCENDLPAALSSLWLARKIIIVKKEGGGKRRSLDKEYLGLASCHRWESEQLSSLALFVAKQVNPRYRCLVFIFSKVIFLVRVYMEKKV